MVWVFEREGERLQYEVRRAPDDSAYELRITYPDGHVQSDRVTEAADLLERCAEVGLALKRDGWVEA
jgi:hypothetical protein